jgi:hypothetical protein
LIVSAWLAMPLAPTVAPMVKGLFGAFSVKNPALIWAVSPVVVFFVVLTLFKVGAFALHRQVEVYYKYKAGDLVLALWERLNKRLGACLGIINALIYTVLISVVIYVMGYWTTQMAQGEGDPSTLRWLNRAAGDLHSTGMDKVVRAIDPMKEPYYLAADIVGVVYHNPLASSRLSSYPSLLGLSERQEFKELANDTAYFEMLQRQVPIAEVLEHGRTKSITGNPDLLKEIWALLVPDLADLREYMLTGKSAKYDNEPILGRWSFNSSASVAALKQSKPNMSVSELKLYRRLINFAYAKSSLVATPAHQAILKDVIAIRPGVKIEGTPEPATRTGDWQGDSSSYRILFSDNNKEMTVKAADGKLTLSGDWTPLVFSKE